MLYFWVKWLHIVSSTILFGTGIGIAFFKWRADRNDSPRLQAEVLRIVVLADWCFTTPAVVIQLVTGLWLVHLAGFSLTAGWIFWALVLYFIAGSCRLPVLWLQLKMRELAESSAMAKDRLPDRYHFYRKIWFALGVSAFLALLIVFYLMVFKQPLSSPWDAR